MHQVVVQPSNTAEMWLWNSTTVHVLSLNWFSILSRCSFMIVDFRHRGCAVDGAPRVYAATWSNWLMLVMRGSSRSTNKAYPPSEVTSSDEGTLTNDSGIENRQWTWQGRIDCVKWWGRRSHRPRWREVEMCIIRIVDVWRAHVNHPVNAAHRAHHYLAIDCTRHCTAISIKTIKKKNKIINIL